MREFAAGLGSYWRAWRLVWKTGMWPLLVAPGMVGLMYFPVVALLAWRYGGSLAAHIRDHWLPEFLQHRVLVVLITAGLWLAGLYLGLILFRTIVMILYAPILSYLSRKTEENLVDAGSVVDIGSGFLRSGVRAIGMSLFSLILAVASLVVCLVLLPIPLIGQAALGIGWPATQMFLAGHGFADPTLERRAVGVWASFRFAWRHRLRVGGCGCGFVLLSLLPVIGWFLAPTLGVVAGTMNGLDALNAERGAGRG